MKYEIHTQTDQGTSVLIDVPFGKRYLSAPDQLVDQQSQKGGTCWYYTNNLMRPRYGKVFPLSFPPRQAEQMISAFRKKMTRITLQDEYLMAFVEKFGPIISKRQVKQTLLSNLATIIDEAKNINVVKELFESFLAQSTFSDLNSYGKMYAHNATMSAYTWILKQFNYDVDDLKKSLDAAIPADWSQEETDSTMQTQFWVAVRKELARHYNFKLLDWRKEDGLDALMKQLMQYGAIKVLGDFGEAFYSKPAYALDKKFGKWDVHAWQPGTYLPGNSQLIHAVVVIGMEKVKQRGYLYYLDPNYPITVSGPNCVFKISYERFLSALYTTDGRLSNEFDIDEGYGYQMDHNKFTYLHDFYTSHQAFRQQDTIDEVTPQPALPPAAPHRTLKHLTPADLVQLSVQPKSNKHLTLADLAQLSAQPKPNKHLTPADLFQHGIQPKPNRDLTPGDLYRYGRLFAAPSAASHPKPIDKAARELTPADLPALVR